ncbi:hypothetical protein [Tardiphaga sp.]|uniref:hypothetical protein n=1 Tax=Tardiphaga sp. TaxID=1926292 RepID=UPI0037D9D212
MIEDGVAPYFFVEISDDDNRHGIIVARFRRFAHALEYYNLLVKTVPPPQMRVVMRHQAHVYRNYIPTRLDNSFDRSRERRQ